MKNLNGSKFVVTAALCMSFVFCSPLVLASDPVPAEPVESTQPNEPVPEPNSPVCSDWPYCIVEKS